MIPILLLGITASAASFIFIRESVEPPVMLAAWRVLLAALVLSPAYAVARRRFGDAPPKTVLQRSLLPGGVLALHFITWVMGARLTPAANATLLVSLMPLVMPFIAFAWFGERLRQRELIATALAFAGVLWMGAADVHIYRQHLEGDLMCLLSMVLFAIYLAMARAQATLPSVWLYVVPMYVVAGLVCLLIAPFFGPVLPVLSAWNILMVGAVAVVSTVIGHTALNAAMRHLRAQTVSVLNLAQFVIAGALGWVVYRELPAQTFYPASALVVLGMLLIIQRGD